MLGKNICSLNGQHLNMLANLGGPIYFYNYVYFMGTLRLKDPGRLNGEPFKRGWDHVMNALVPRSPGSGALRPCSSTEASAPLPIISAADGPSFVSSFGALAFFALESSSGH